MTSECCAAWLQDLQCAKYNHRSTGNLERCSHGRLRTAQVASSGHGGETGGGFGASEGGGAGCSGDGRQGGCNGWAEGLQRGPHAVLGVSSNATRPEIRQVGTIRCQLLIWFRAASILQGRVQFCLRLHLLFQIAASWCGIL